MSRQGAAEWLRGTSVALLIGASALVPSAAWAQSYRVDGKKSSIVVHLLKGGIASAFAHDHVIAARAVSGVINLPRRGGVPFEQAQVSVQVNARSLDVDPPALRRAYKLQGVLSRKDRQKVAANMHAKDQLWTSRFPSIRFVSTAIEAKGKQGFRVRGKLTLRGVTRSVALVVRVRAGARIKVSGTLRIKQSDFGYKPYSGGLGTVKVKDAATINIYLEAARQ